MYTKTSELPQNWLKVNPKLLGYWSSSCYYAKQRDPTLYNFLWTWGVQKPCYTSAAHTSNCGFNKYSHTFAQRNIKYECFLWNIIKLGFKVWNSNIYISPTQQSPVYSPAYFRILGIWWPAAVTLLSLKKSCFPSSFMSYAPFPFRFTQWVRLWGPTPHTGDKTQSLLSLG